jgi:DNA uptake protein ComE-like DNA-binding protein
VELDTLQKQEEGIQAQLDREVTKLNTLSIQSQNTKDQIKIEKDRIDSDLTGMIKQSSEHQDERDGLQSDIYRLQRLSKKITTKRDSLRSQLSDKVVNTAERVSELEERIIYKNTDDHLSFVIEGLERVGPESDQNIIAQQIIAESIEIDTNEVVFLKKSLKKFRQPLFCALSKFFKRLF